MRYTQLRTNFCVYHSAKVPKKNFLCPRAYSNLKMLQVEKKFFFHFSGSWCFEYSPLDQFLNPVFLFKTGHHFCYSCTLCSHSWWMDRHHSTASYELPVQARGLSLSWRSLPKSKHHLLPIHPVSHTYSVLLFDFHFHH